MLQSLRKHPSTSAGNVTEEDGSDSSCQLLYRLLYIGLNPCTGWIVYNLAGRILWVNSKKTVLL